MRKKFELNLVERAFAICKRYNQLAEKYDLFNKNDAAKYDAYLQRMYHTTWNILSRTEYMCSRASAIYYMIVAIVENGKSKSALFDAINLLGIELV